MEITLIRHGESTWQDRRPIRGEDVEKWVIHYNESGIIDAFDLAKETKQKVDRCTLIVTSHLRRSIESAHCLTKEKEVITSPLFEEAPLPAVPRLLPFSFSPKTWTVILRLLWLFGYAKDCLSHKETKERAKDAAEMLITLAHQHSSVLLVGHGMFNRFIANELRRQGWETETKGNSKHWSHTTFTYR